MKAGATLINDWRIGIGAACIVLGIWLIP